MQDWTKQIQMAIDYIEEHLTEEVDVHDVAAYVYVSAYHFQRIFSAMCGMPLGEYVRRRRLTLAAQELTQGMQVIDAAVKYGYDSPDSFARAFRRFHGILPSHAQQSGASLKSFTPMKITKQPEGGIMLEYRIVEKAAFTVVGYCRSFSNETSYQEIPKWWEEVMQQKTEIMGKFGLCIDSDGRDFDYLICDLCQPWKDVPEGCVTREIPGGTWAVFPCTLETLQDTNTKMWRDWLPSCSEYQLSGNYNIELYFENQPTVELWLPVKQVK